MASSCLSGRWVCFIVRTVVPASLSGRWECFIVRTVVPASLSGRWVCFIVRTVVPASLSGRWVCFIVRTVVPASLSGRWVCFIVRTVVAIYVSKRKVCLVLRTKTLVTMSWDGRSGFSKIKVFTNSTVYFSKTITTPEDLKDIPATLYANGTVMIHYEASFTSHCEVKTKWFPFDTHQCVLVIGPFDSSATEVKYCCLFSFFHDVQCFFLTNSSKLAQFSFILSDR